MGNRAESTVIPEEDSDDKIYDRIVEYFRRPKMEKKKCLSNLSEHFREVFFIGENQTIHDRIFFDCGVKKGFRELSFRRTEFLDGYYETTVSDPQKDKKVENLVEEMRMVWERMNKEAETKSTEESRINLLERKLEMSKILIERVVRFFGGLDFEEGVEEKCEEVIENLKERNDHNIIYLGDLEGCGVCRHRSILFKLLCDALGDREFLCRILRGHLTDGSRKLYHMWNELVIDGKVHAVDCMNSLYFIEEKIYSETYVNRGHPVERDEKLQENISNLSKEYKRGNHLGNGTIGNVYQFVPGGENIDFFLGKYSRNELAVKEINISTLRRDNPNIRVEKIIQKEIEQMFVMRHPNVIQVYGSFVLKDDETMDETLHVVMKCYDIHAEKFLGKIKNYKCCMKRKSTEVLIMLIEIAKGLLYIHSFGIVHFDIKPKNILLNWNDRNHRIDEVVISDFGSSKTEKMTVDHTTLPNVTRKYAAPEILKLLEEVRNGKNSEISKIPFSPKSDIFSFGLLMADYSLFFDDFDYIQSVQRRCVLKRPEERPNLYEVIYHLTCGLNEMRDSIVTSVEGDVGKEMSRESTSDRKPPNLYTEAANRILKRKISESQENVDKLTKSLENYEESVRLLQEKTEELECYNEDKSRKITDLNEKLSDYQENMGKLTKSLGDSKKLVARFEGKVKHFNAVSEELKQEKSKFEKKSNEFTVQELRIERMVQALDEKGKVIDKLNRRVQIREKIVKMKENKVKRAKEANEDTKRELFNCRTTIDSLYQQISEYEKNLLNKDESIRVLENRVKKREKDNVWLRQKMRSSVLIIDSLKKEKSILEGEKESAISKLQSSQFEASHFLNKFELAKKEFGEFLTKTPLLSSQKGDVGKLMKMVEQLREALRYEKKGKKEAEDHLTNMSEEMNKMEVQLQNLLLKCHTDKQSFDDEVQKLKERIEDLELQLLVNRTRNSSERNSTNFNTNRTYFDDPSFGVIQKCRKCHQIKILVPGKGVCQTCNLMIRCEKCGKCNCSGGILCVCKNCFSNSCDGNCQRGGFFGGKKGGSGFFLRIFCFYKKI